MLFHNRRMARRLRAAAEHIEVVDDTKRNVLDRSWQAPPKIAHVEEIRTITAAKGRRVRVVQKRQLEMAL